MPDEYTALVNALSTASIPFAEYGWKTRPEGAYGVVALDMEAGNLDGDGSKADRSFEGSLDIYFPKLSSRAELAAEVETALTGACGDSWGLNSIQYENETGLFHIEWVFRVFGTITAPEDGDG